MRKSILLVLILIGLPTFAQDMGAQDLRQAIESDYEDYLSELFLHFHQNPELSTVEHRTAERMAVELRNAGFTVTEGVGGTGVVAIIKNGEGPTVMLRADMDGLPVVEQSGLPFASKVRAVARSGVETGVMHA